MILRTNLLSLQQELLKSGSFPVLLDFSGVRGAGKGSSVNLLTKWMDARWIRVHAYDVPTDEESGRPTFWKFWRQLPPRGQIGIHMSGRYSRPLLDFVYGNITQDQFKRQLDRINNFEKALADDGALILKFWMHISQDVQRQRLESLAGDPLRSWRMSELDWKHYELYDRFIEAAEQIITVTNTGHAPWEIVEGEDFNYRSLRVGEILQGYLERHLVAEDIRQKYLVEVRKKMEEQYEEHKDEVSQNGLTILDQLDFSKHLDKKNSRRPSRSARRDSPTCTRKPFRRISPPSWCSRGRTPPARAAASGRSPRCSTPAISRSTPSPRRPTSRTPITTCGASGVASRWLAA